MKKLVLLFALTAASACNAATTTTRSPPVPVAQPSKSPVGAPAVAPVSLVVMLDRSGSMSGARLESAKKALLDANDALHDDERLEVIVFDSTARRAVAMRWGSERAETALEIGRITAGGGTDIEPAMALAADDLAGLKSTKKHAILLTDGMSPKGKVEALARTMADAGVTLTTIALGDDADVTTMKTLAMIGGGRFHHVTDPKHLSAIVAKELAAARM